MLDDDQDGNGDGIRDGNFIDNTIFPLTVADDGKLRRRQEVNVVEERTR